MGGKGKVLVKKTVVLSKEINDLVEKARKELGMNTSELLKVCIIRFLEDNGLIAEKMAKIR